MKMDGGIDEDPAVLHIWMLVRVVVLPVDLHDVAALNALLVTGFFDIDGADLIVPPGYLSMVQMDHHICHKFADSAVVSGFAAEVIDKDYPPYGLCKWTAVYEIQIPVLN